MKLTDLMHSAVRHGITFFDCAEGYGGGTCESRLGRILHDTSTDNDINHATIKNGTVGILCDGNQSDPTKLTITNSQVYNSSNFGILGRATSIYGENLVINNSGQSSFAGTIGGSYNFVHSTFANYWSNSFRQFPSVFLNNFVLDENLEPIPNPLDAANFTNCIIYGNDNPEFLVERDSGAAFAFKLTECLIRFNDPNGNFSGNELYNFNDDTYYEGLIRNDDPLFLDPQANKFQIPNESPANGEAIPFGILNSDITNTTRGNPADLGAYESDDLDD